MSTNYSSPADFVHFSLGVLGDGCPIVGGNLGNLEEKKHVSVYYII
jgi:hypothetical protein